MHDILRETPIYQKILEEGHLEGLQEGLKEGELRALRATIVDIVQARFPTLVRFAKKQLVVAENPDELRQLVVKLSRTTTLDEARQYLYQLDKDLEDE